MIVLEDLGGSLSKDNLNLRNCPIIGDFKIRSESSWSNETCVADSFVDVLVIEMVEQVCTNNADNRINLVASNPKKIKLLEQGVFNGAAKEMSSFKGLKGICCHPRNLGNSEILAAFIEPKRPWKWISLHRGYAVV